MPASDVRITRARHILVGPRRFVTAVTLSCNVNSALYWKLRGRLASVTHEVVATPPAPDAVASTSPERPAALGARAVLSRSHQSCTGQKLSQAHFWQPSATANCPLCGLPTVPPGFIALRRNGKEWPNAATAARLPSQSRHTERFPAPRSVWRFSLQRKSSRPQDRSDGLPMP